MEKPQKTSTIGGKWRWLLGISLALNLLVIGTLAGAAWRHAGGDGRFSKGGAGFATPYLRALPREARQEMRALMPRKDEDRRKAFEARRAHYGQIAAALAAEPFDANALSALVAVQGDSALARQQKGQAAWIKVVSDMDGAERQAYSVRLLEIIDRSKRRKWRED